MITLSEPLDKTQIQISDNASEEEIARTYQKYYNILVRKFLNAEISCTEAKCKGHFVYNGKYSRIIWIRGRKIYLTFVQVRCNKCGKTHVILTADLVPYSHIPVDTHIAIGEVCANELSAAVSNGAQKPKEEALSNARHDLEDMLEGNTDYCSLDLSAFLYIARIYFDTWDGKLKGSGLDIFRQNISVTCLEKLHAQVMQAALKYKNYRVGLTP